MKTLFDMLCHGHILSKQEAKQLLFAICNQQFNASQISAIMALYIARPVSVNELSGFREALLEQCIPVNLSKDAIDVCGTGGDHKNTFNISTLSAIVLAASGIPVAKHGNYGSSSVSGSSDILLHLGYQFPKTENELNDQLEKYNICFLHAPLFHPTLKHVSQQRKEIGVRTFFNLLGPLVNPANPKFQYIGVYHQEVARLYNYLLQASSSNYSIVYSTDGYDEISLTSSFKHITKNGEHILNPQTLGLNYITPESIYGGNSIADAAEIFINVLNNNASTEQKQVVIANSAMAMNCYKPNLTITECVERCTETIESKAAYQLFKSITQ